MKNQPAPPSDAAVASVVSADTRFGFKLFTEILKQESLKNVFVSPASVAFALSMTYNGASSETQQAMAKALELQGLSPQDVNHANAVLKTTLENLDPKIQLTIANSLWARKGVSFKPQFMQRNQEFFGAQVVSIDFDSAAPAVINAWVGEKTGGKIDKIIENIHALAILILINAIYFKGKWTDEFDRAQTKEDVFTLPDGRQKKHPLMSQSGHFRYYRGEKFQAVSLPYSDGRVSMYVFLPDKDSSLAEFHKRLTPAHWDGWMTRFHPLQGYLVLPRFKLQYELDLNDALAALGMGVAFDAARANFRDMCRIPATPNVFIDQVRHKTFVEVNEEGTEAAAVTGVLVQVTAFFPTETFTMIVDRPFFCAIRDNRTGLVLFMGSIVDPT